MDLPNLFKPDNSAKTGLYLGAMAVGSSFQPGLLTRGSRDQAIITAASAGAGYVAATAGSAIVNSIRRRLPIQLLGGLDIALVATGVGIVATNKPEENEQNSRALIRLGGIVATGLGLAGGVNAVASAAERKGSTAASVGITIGAACALAGATYAFLHPRGQTVGALDPDEVLLEDSHREVNSSQAIAMSGAAIGGIFAIAYGESFITRVLAGQLSRVVGGEAHDHQTLARVGSIAANAFVARLIMSKLSASMTRAGSSMEVAHSRQPQASEVTGSPASGVKWNDLSREGRRWLSMALTPEDITKVMGEPAIAPIRAYAPLEVGDNDFDRAQFLLSELDRTNAFDRSILALFSPTGSGYINYVASESLEYLTKGDCALAGIEYSVLPSSMALTAVPLGSRQTRLVIDGIVERLMARAPEDRPRFVLFGESLGSQVSQDVFVSQGLEGLHAAGIESAFWIGTPSASKWRKQIWGGRSVFEKPEIGPGDAYLPRGVADWHEMPIDEKKKVKYLLLQNADDPVPKFGSDLFWKEPPWLYFGVERPPGSPRGTRWVPFVTGIQTFIDLINALTPTPGVFSEGGHDYRVEISPAISVLWNLDSSEEQHLAILDALKEREFGWELARRWLEAQAKTPVAKREKAISKVQTDVTHWLDRDPSDNLVSVVEIEELLKKTWW